MKDIYVLIKKYGEENYPLESTEFITCWLLSKGGIFVDSVDEIKTDKVFRDLYHAGFRFNIKKLNRYYVFPESLCTGNKKNERKAEKRIISFYE